MFVLLLTAIGDASCRCGLACLTAYNMYCNNKHASGVEGLLFWLSNSCIEQTRVRQLTDKAKVEETKQPLSHEHILM